MGRMASEVAKLLLGKHKATFTPGADVGDYVIIVNAEKARSPIPLNALSHSSIVPHSSHAYTAVSCPTARSSTCPCSQVIVTGKKYEQKLYRRHSGRPGGMKIENFEELQKRIPERIVEKVACPPMTSNLVVQAALVALDSSAMLFSSGNRWYAPEELAWSRVVPAPEGVQRIGASSRGAESRSSHFRWSHLNA